MEPLTLLKKRFVYPEEQCLEYLSMIGEVKTGGMPKKNLTPSNAKSASQFSWILSKG